MRIVEIFPNSSENTYYLDEIFRLRAKVFSGRLHWSVTVREGRESDEFDDYDPTYLALVSAQNQVLGSVRLLPMSGPTMIGTVFRHLVDDLAAAAPGVVVESSRFFVDTEALAATQEAGHATEMLMNGIITWAAEHHFASIITVTDVRIERLMRRIGIPHSRVSSPQRIGETICVVLTIPAYDPARALIAQPSRDAVNLIAAPAA